MDCRSPERPECRGTEGVHVVFGFTSCFSMSCAVRSRKHIKPTLLTSTGLLDLLPMDFLRRKDTVRKLETSPHLVSSNRVAHVESSEGSWFYLLSVLRVFVPGSIFLH